MNTKLLWAGCLFLFTSLILPIHSSAYSGPGAWRVKRMQRNLKSAQRYIKRGKLKRAKRTYKYYLLKAKKNFLKAHPDQANNADIKSLFAKIEAVRAKLYPNAAPSGGAPTIKRRGGSRHAAMKRHRQALAKRNRVQGNRGTRRNIGNSPSNGRNRGSAQDRFDNARLKKIANTKQIRQMLIMRQFGMANRLLASRKKWLTRTVRTRPTIKESDPRVQRIRTKFRKLQDMISQRNVPKFSSNRCTPTACMTLQSKYGWGCPSSYRTTKQVTRVGIKRFFKYLNKFQRAYDVVVPFFKKNPTCCNSYVRALNTRCKNARGFFRKRWRSYLRGLNGCRRKNSTCREAIRRNQHPLLRLKTSFLSKSISGNIAAGKRKRARYRAKVATRSCPKPDRYFRNPSLMKKLKRAIYEAGRYYKRYGIKFKKYFPATKRFTRYNRYTKNLVENIYLRVCFVERTKSGNRCYHRKLRIFRVKPKGSPYWNRWKPGFHPHRRIEFNCSKM